MNNFEYYPVLIEAHRNDLRSLAARVPYGVEIPSRRMALGRMFIRLGRWLEGHRPESLSDVPAVLGNGAGSV